MGVLASLSGYTHSCALLSSPTSLGSAGGIGGKATFIRAITFTQGPGVKAVGQLVKVGKTWQMLGGCTAAELEQQAGADGQRGTPMPAGSTGAYLALLGKPILNLCMTACAPFPQ